MATPHSINAKRVVIRRFKKSDTKGFIKFMTDNRITDNLVFDENSKSEHGAKDLLTITIRSYDKEQPMMAFAIEDKTTGEFIGVCGLNPHNDLEIEVFYALLPEAWGKGLATEVLESLKDFIFAKTNYSTIKAFIKRTNNSSKKVVLKNNFINLGLVDNEQFSDQVYLFSLTKE